MRKPGAARLVNWFYELPPYRWFLPFGGSGPVSETGLQPQYAPAGDACQGAILGPKAGWTRLSRPFVPVGYEASLKTGVSLHPPPAGMYRGAYYLSTPLTGLANGVAWV